jgi:hypothetical protein
MWLLVGALGVLLIMLSAFGVQLGPVDLFKLGCGLCFAAGGLAIYWPRTARVA